MRWLLRIKEYYRDKALANKCGLDIKNICKHECDEIIYCSESIRKHHELEDKCQQTDRQKCKKCGEFYN